jgi:hypothetical protein
MEFLNISSLGTTYQYAIKIEHKFNRISEIFDLRIPHSRSREKETPTHITKDGSRMAYYRKTSLRQKKRKVMGRQRKKFQSGLNSIKYLDITPMNVTQRIHWFLI